MTYKKYIRERRVAIDLRKIPEVSVEDVPLVDEASKLTQEQLE
jgi:hypothetical protein